VSQGQRFRRRALRRGYKVDEVDAFLDRVEATLNGEAGNSPVAAQEVHDVVFRVRFGGYDEWQVDLHLDRVERQLGELEERVGFRPQERPMAAADRLGPSDRLGPLGPMDRMGPGPADRLGPLDRMGAGDRLGPPPVPVMRDDRMAPPDRIPMRDDRMMPPVPDRMGPPRDDRMMPPPPQPQQMPPQPMPRPVSPMASQATGAFARFDEPRFDDSRYDEPTGSFGAGPGAGYEPFEPGRHGKMDMTTEIRMPPHDMSGATGPSGDMYRVDQLRRTFQPRRFGSGYDPVQVDRLFEGILATMSSRGPSAINDAELDPGQFNLVPGGYFEAEVDQALREVRDILRRR
jgi:DivIVA domain-containing protein